MNKTVLCLLAAPAIANAQIYRCDTPHGPVFSDERCGRDASVVTLEDDSSGLGGGPPEEVREYLARKRQQRAEQQAQKPEFEPRPAPADAVLRERIEELERQRLYYLPTPANAAEIARLQRQIAKLKAARNPPGQARQSQTWRVEDR